MSIKKNTKYYDALAEISALQGPVSFGELIRSLRISDEVSQTDLAENLGISKQHLSAIEKGRKAVSPAQAAKFAEAMGYPADQFVVAAIEDELREAGVIIHFDFRKAAGI
jgi:transcriptional regulator with XRE-family HTH domain